jgi:hypothetical protein
MLQLYYHSHVLGRHITTLSLVPKTPAPGTEATWPSGSEVWEGQRSRANFSCDEAEVLPFLKVLGDIVLKHCCSFLNSDNMLQGEIVQMEKKFRSVHSKLHGWEQD